MKTKYTIDYRNSSGELIEIKEICVGLTQAKARIKEYAKSMSVPVGYWLAGRNESYLDIGLINTSFFKRAGK